MIFGNFFSKNFSFDISKWSSPLSDWKTGIVIVAYFCLNCFLPLCFELLELQLTVAPITAFLLVWFYLYFSDGKIPEICSFQQPKQGESVKIIIAVLLSLFQSMKDFCLAHGAESVCVAIHYFIFSSFPLAELLIAPSRSAITSILASSVNIS